jgi:hypothetical protein
MFQEHFCCKFVDMNAVEASLIQELRTSRGNIMIMINLTECSVILLAS